MKKKSKLSREKEQYFRLYKSWDKAYCPALKNDVLFTNNGWQHLFEQKFRTSSEMENRLRLLPLARKMLEKSNFWQKREFNSTTKHTQFIFYGNIEGTYLTVVVIEDRKKYIYRSHYEGQKM